MGARQAGGKRAKGLRRIKGDARRPLHPTGT